MRIPLPRLLDAQLREVRRIHPVRVNIDETLAPLSSASMTLPPEENVDVRAFVELFTAQGSAGVFRVTAVEESYTGEMLVTLQHGLVTLQDALMPGEGERDTSAQALLTELLSHQKGDIRWTLDEVAVPESENLHWEYDHSNLLSSLCDILGKLPGYRLTVDQSALPWALGLAAAEEEPTCECRASRNLSGVTVSRDDSDLVTRLYAQGLPEPIEADTIGIWGPVERTLSVDEDLGEELIRKAAMQELEAFKNPLITVSMDALELSRQTGETLDALTLGRLCRVCLPEWDTTITQRIVALSWPDVYGQPESVTVTLANRAENAADAIAGLVVDTTLLKKGYGDNKRKLTLQAQTIELLAQDILLQAERIQANADLIELKASSAELNEAVHDIRQAEIAIDGLQAAIELKASTEQFSALDRRVTTAEADIDGLNARIDLKADASMVNGLAERVTSAEASIDGLNAKITLKADATTVSELTGAVTGLTDRVTSAEADIDGLNAKITLKADATVTDGLETRLSSAELSIDGLNSQITLKADRIDLQGYVTADELDAAVVSAIESFSQEFYTTDLYASTANISSRLDTGFLVANTVSTGALTLDGTSIGMTSRSLVTGIYWPNYYTTTKTIHYMNPDGVNESAEVVTGVFGVTSPTLQYEEFYYVGGTSE